MFFGSSVNGRGDHHTSRASDPVLLKHALSFLVAGARERYYKIEGECDTEIGFLVSYITFDFDGGFIFGTDRFSILRLHYDFDFGDPLPNDTSHIPACRRFAFSDYHFLSALIEISNIKESSIHFFREKAVIGSIPKRNGSPVVSFSLHNALCWFDMDNGVYKRVGSIVEDAYYPKAERLAWSYDAIVKYAIEKKFPFSCEHTRALFRFMQDASPFAENYPSPDENQDSDGLRLYVRLKSASLPLLITIEDSNGDILIDYLLSPSL